LLALAAREAHTTTQKTPQEITVLRRVWVRFITLPVAEVAQALTLFLPQATMWRTPVSMAVPAVLARFTTLEVLRLAVLVYPALEIMAVREHLVPLLVVVVLVLLALMVALAAQVAQD